LFYFALKNNIFKNDVFFNTLNIVVIQSATNKLLSFCANYTRDLVRY